MLCIMNIGSSSVSSWVPKLIVHYSWRIIPHGERTSSMQHTRYSASCRMLALILTYLRNLAARILLGPHSCVSTQVLLGFTWSHTALRASYCVLCGTPTDCSTVFWYFTLLTAFCLVRQTSEPGIWHSYIRDISNPVLFRRLTGNDTPAQPLPKFLPEKKFSVPIIAAPKPRRPPPPRDTITGLQTYYDVEPYTHDPHKHPPLPSSTIFPMTPGLYSQQVQSAIPAFPAAARTMYPPERRRTPSPPPLGDWPRADIISRPTPRKTTRKVTTLERVPEPDFIDDGSPSHRLVRPGGPRMRSESASRPRPPPLDLSKGKARGS